MKIRDRIDRLWSRPEARVAFEADEGWTEHERNLATYQIDFRTWARRVVRLPECIGSECLFGKLSGTGCGRDRECPLSDKRNVTEGFPYG